MNNTKELVEQTKREQYIYGKVVEIVSEQMCVDASEITRDTHFINDLNADSLDAVELVMEFEDEFEMSVPDEEFEKTHTVGQVIAYIKEHSDVMKPKPKLTVTTSYGQSVVRNGKPKPKPYIDNSIATGDVTEGLIINHVYHLVTKPGTVYHVIWHESDNRLEILEKPELYIGAKDFQSACVEARKKLK